jgi:hypothetical protein
MSDRSKITDAHRRRRAVIYVRQSSRSSLSATTSRALASTRCGSARSSSAGRPPRSRSVDDDLGAREPRPTGLGVQGAGR